MIVHYEYIISQTGATTQFGGGKENVGLDVEI